MKRTAFALTVLTTTTLLTVTAFLLQAQEDTSPGGAAAEMPPMPQPQEEHSWLQQIVGEWETVTEIHMEPGQPPMKAEGTETVRAVGGFWVVGESWGEMMGMPFHGISTMGYDLEKEAFVGTWIDSMNSYLWNYVGTLSEDGKSLILSTEGPCPMTPGIHTKFQEVLEIKSPDHKVFTSSIQGEDGKWVKMIEVNARRKS